MFLQFGLVSDPIWPIFELDLDIIQTNILTKFQAAPAKNAAVFDPAWPIFELGLDIIQLNILIKFQAAEAKHAASTELTRFSLNLA